MLVGSTYTTPLPAATPLLCSVPGAMHAASIEQTSHGAFSVACSCSNAPGFTQSDLGVTLQRMNLGFLGFFVLEGVIKVLALGLWLRPGTYLRNGRRRCPHAGMSRPRPWGQGRNEGWRSSAGVLGALRLLVANRLPHALPILRGAGWNVLDALVIVTGFISIFFDSNLTAFRGFKALMPLRTITHIPKLRVRGRAQPPRTARAARIQQAGVSRVPSSCRPHPPRRASTRPRAAPRRPSS